MTDIVEEYELKEAEIRMLFTKYDHDASGFIEINELKTLLLDLKIVEETGEGDLDDKVKAELEKADENHDGKISFQEFIVYHNNCIDLNKSKDAPGGAHSKPDRCMVQPAGGGGGASASKQDKDYETAILNYVKNLEGTGGDSGGEWSGNSGTKTDTVVEKSAGQELRGESAYSDQSGIPGLMEPSAGYQGRWLRTMNKQGTCYLYVHTTTHEITGIKPDNFYDADEERRKALMLAAGEAPGMTSCFLETLIDTCREVIASERKTPLLLAPSDALYDAIVEYMAVQVDVDKKKQPILRGWMVDTRPFVWGQTKTGIKFEDAVKNAKIRIKKAVTAGAVVCIDIRNTPPNFAEKICGVDKYRAQFPMTVFDPSARGWRKDLIGFQPKQETDIVVCLSTSDHTDYERDLKENLDPMPWGLLHPVLVKATPVEVVSMSALADQVAAATTSGRASLVLDATENKGQVKMFFEYQRSFVVNVMKFAVDTKGVTPLDQGGMDEISGPMEDLRKQIIGAMKAGYYLVFNLAETNPRLIDYFHEEYFPKELFTAMAPEEITKQPWLEKIVREEDKESGVFVVREGFHVVVATSCPLEKFRSHLSFTIPLNKMKLLVAMDN